MGFRICELYQLTDIINQYFQNISQYFQLGLFTFLVEWFHYYVASSCRKEGLCVCVEEPGHTVNESEVYINLAFTWPFGCTNCS